MRSPGDKNQPKTKLRPFYHCGEHDVDFYYGGACPKCEYNKVKLNIRRYKNDKEEDQKRRKQAKLAAKTKKVNRQKKKKKNV